MKKTEVDLAALVISWLTDERGIPRECIAQEVPTETGGPIDILVEHGGKTWAIEVAKRADLRHIDQCLRRRDMVHHVSLACTGGPLAYRVLYELGIGVIQVTDDGVLELQDPLTRVPIKHRVAQSHPFQTSGRGKPAGSPGGVGDPKRAERNAALVASVTETPGMSPLFYVDVASPVDEMQAARAFFYAVKRGHIKGLAARGTFKNSRIWTTETDPKGARK